MNAFIARLQALLGPRAGIVAALGAPIAVLLVLSMMVLPLPPFALDLLFTFNIAMAVMVMMVAAHMVRPLDFAAFPTVLLLTTLMRLSLNVASTRVVLLEGHTGTGAAGHVIESFGHFLIGGNFAVGLIVFAILVVINFIVVTKGAERIAEVGARFTLDAMPGKQMAVDADLNAGLINEGEAKRRRAELGDEADFFGSMDGASKFVRGDAVAGILILVINIVGGFIIGVAQHGLSASQAADSYILLAVGDALVAQVPALLISVAAAMVVSRVGTSEDVGSQIGSQVFGSAKSLAVTSGVIGALGLIPGMPHLVFLLIAGGMGWLAWWLRTKQQAAAAKALIPPPPVTNTEPNGEATWNDLIPVDTLGLEVGYRLITLVNKSKEGDLLSRIKGVRRKFAQEVGFLPPAVHIRDNLDLRPSQYRFSLRGAVIGEAEAFPGMWLAINPGHATQKLIGTQTTDPAFGLPAVWIEERQKEMAQMAGFTVVDCSTVVATHLSHLMQVHAAKLLGRVETQALVEHLTKQAPQLIEDVIPKMIGIATLQKVLQLLLEEGVHIRDMRSIVESIAENATVTDPAELARRIRVHLAPAIVQQIYGAVKELDVIALEPELERLVTQALNSPHGAALDPGVADSLTRNAAQTAQAQEDRGIPAALLVPDLIRAPMARLLRRAAPRLKVLGHSEIPETHSIRIGSIIGSTA